MANQVEARSSCATVSPFLAIVNFAVICLFSLSMIAALRLAGALYMEDAATSFALSRVDASFTNNVAGADGGNDSKGENKEMDRCKSPPYLSLLLKHHSDSVFGQLLPCNARTYFITTTLGREQTTPLPLKQTSTWDSLQNGSGVRCPTSCTLAASVLRGIHRGSVRVTSLNSCIFLPYLRLIR